MIRNEWAIHGSGLAWEAREPLLAASSCIMLQAVVDVWLAKCAQAGDQTGELVGHGRDGCGRAEAGAEASIVGPQRAWAVEQRLRGPAQGGSGAVDHVAGAACEPVAAAETVVRTAAEPRGDGLFGLPPAQVQAARREAGLGGEPREAVEAGHVDATDAVEVRVEINVRLVAAGFLRPTRQRGPRGG